MNGGQHQGSLARLHDGGGAEQRVALEAFGGHQRSIIPEGAAIGARNAAVALPTPATHPSR